MMASLWHTFKSLLTRPGQVACEYMEGKRNRHLEPIRYYVFASSVFFLMFFLFVVNQDDVITGDQAKNYDKRMYRLEQEKKFLKDSPDTVHANQLITSLKLKSGDTIAIMGDTILDDSIATVVDSMTHDLEIGWPNMLDIPQDSIGWFGRFQVKRYEQKTKEMKQKHEGDDNQALKDFGYELLHTLPQLIFLSLPFFALFLKLLYWRSRKGRYVEHFIFSIYNYAFLFTLFLFYILIGWLLSNLEETPLESYNWLGDCRMVFYPFIYLFLSMKRFYSDRIGRLILRYMFLMTLMTITILMLFLLFLVITFLL